MIFSKNICLLAVCTSLFHTAVARRNRGFNSTSSAVGSATAVSSAVSSASTNTSSDAAAAAVTSITADANVGNNNNNNNGGASASANGDASLTLSANAIQTGSESDGLADATAGQSGSATDNANFINFCAGKELTNGQQIAGGSCNGIVMGDIPSSQNMISTIITNPGPGDTIAANQDFTVNIQVANLVAGSFTNPQSTYYSAPQALSGGKIVGHTHITIQSLGNNIATTTPPDAGTFAFFKGINDAGDGNGGLSAAVAGGLPAGVYRVCTMTSASNHQPVTMPLAQRGAQDDCNKFTVTDGGANTGNTNTGNTNTGNANTGNANTGNANTGSATTSSATTSIATTNSNNNSSSAASGNQNGRGRKNRGSAKGFALREFVA